MLELSDRDWIKESEVPQILSQVSCQRETEWSDNLEGSVLEIVGDPWNGCVSSRVTNLLPFDEPELGCEVTINNYVTKPQNYYWNYHSH